MRTPTVVSALVMTVAAGVACMACGGGGEPTGKKAAERGEWETSKEMPTDLAQLLPAYPKAELVKSVSGDGAVVVWQAPDRVRVVEQFYMQQLARDGWTVRKQPGVAAAWMGKGGVTLSARKAGVSIAISVGEKDNGSAITAVFQKKG
jgi:hypothetical protein